MQNDIFNAKKHKNIAFHNFKIKCTRNKTSYIPKLIILTIKVQNCKLHKNEIFDVLCLFWNRTSAHLILNYEMQYLYNQ